MVKISVIVPVYNSEDYISECIESILNQTYQNFEIILIDDGSTDKSGAICDKFKNSYEKISVIHKINGGVSSARNRGIEESNGEYLIFIDSDDYIDNNLLSVLVNVVHKYNIDTIIHTLDFKFGTNESDSCYYNVSVYNKHDIIKNMPLFIKKRYVNSPCNKLYSKKIIENYEIKFNENLSLGEDALFNYYYFSNISELVIINNNFYYYRYNVSSLTHTYNRYKIDMLLHVNDKLQELVDTTEVYSECRSAANYIRIKGIYSSLFDVIGKNKVTKNEKDILYKKIFNESNRFKIKDIDEFSFKILATLVNIKNKYLLELFSIILDSIIN